MSPFPKQESKKTTKTAALVKALRKKPSSKMEVDGDEHEAAEAALRKGGGYGGSRHVPGSG